MGVKRTGEEEAYTRAVGNQMLISYIVSNFINSCTNIGTLSCISTTIGSTVVAGTSIQFPATLGKYVPISFSCYQLTNVLLLYEVQRQIITVHVVMEPGTSSTEFNVTFRGHSSNTRFTVWPQRLITAGADSG